MPAAPLAYPTPSELREAERVLLPSQTLDDEIFKEFPIREVNSWRLKWRQRDNFVGLQQVRGMGGAFKVVEATGVQEYDFEPGVYGDKALIEENELTEAAQLASWEEFIPITDIVADRQMQLIVRRLDRIRKILWDMLTTGKFQVFDRGGTLKHVADFVFKKITVDVPWSTLAAAKPYADLVAIPLQARGQSASFGAGAKAYVNRKKLNQILLNANAGDLFGRRTAVGATVNTLADLNKLLASQNETQDIPEIACYDRGYLSDGTDGNAKGAFVPFIPDDKCVIIGKRTNGATLGEYRLTRNANNADSAPGPYTRVRDMREFKSPPEVECEDGHNGGPVVFFGGAVVVVTC